MRKGSDKENTKVCPYCAETIKAKAIICRYCKKNVHEFDNLGGFSHAEPAIPKPDSQEISHKAKRTSDLKILFIAVVVILVIIFSCVGFSSIGDLSDGGLSVGSRAPQLKPLDVLVLAEYQIRNAINTSADLLPIENPDICDSANSLECIEKNYITLAGDMVGIILARFENEKKARDWAIGMVVLLKERLGGEEVDSGGNRWLVKQYFNGAPIYHCVGEESGVAIYFVIGNDGYMGESEALQKCVRLLDSQTHEIENGKLGN